jgi:glycerate 2-kinase
MDYREQTVSVFKTVLEKVNPFEIMPDQIQWDSDSEKLSFFGQHLTLHADTPLFVIGSGKASASMAGALEYVFKDRIHSGMVISSPNPLHTPEMIRVLIGSHPYPDQQSVSATDTYLDFLSSIPSGSLVINMLSGGTSSLLCKPAVGLSISDVSKVYKLLIDTTATINEINTIRKVLSSVKGGQLLNYLNEVKLIDLIISDVPDDEIRDIGSGPTIPQEISGSRAGRIAEKYNLWDQFPISVKKQIEEGTGNERENGLYKVKDKKLHQSVIISSASLVAKEAAALFRKRGISVHLDESPWSGPVDQFEEYIMNRVERSINEPRKPTAFIFYGECTVHVKGSGKGGRNQELALRMAKRISNSGRDMVFMSAGTDGIDGPTDAAGAVVDQNTVENAQKNGLDIDTFLNNSDSYTFFSHAGGHIKTGPTGNNVMDLQFLIVH